MDNAMRIYASGKPNEVFDYHFTLKCPSCGRPSNMSAVSFPHYEYIERFRLTEVGIVYRCDACNGPVFLKFRVQKIDPPNTTVTLSREWTEVVPAAETFDMARLPSTVAGDFAEALTCYSNRCFNAFGAMCRRTVQSTSAQLGAKGKDRVLKQLEELKAMAEIDDESFDILKTIVVAGHDGAHPHLPALSEDRATILLELMKDILYQLFVRKKKLEEAAAKRRDAIQNSPGSTED